MITPNQLEESYKEFSQNLSRWVPDGIITVNLNLLEELGLLKHAELERNQTDKEGHCFHVIETPEKVTLFNEQFAIWIVPTIIDEESSTLTYIALLNQAKPHLELVFSTNGVYNSPKYILKVLQHALTEVLDTERLIDYINRSSGG